MAKYSREQGPGSKDIIWTDDGSHAAAAGEEGSYTIGDLAGAFNVTLRALRFYENKGLLTPRREGQSRRYSARDRARLALILQGKRLGFTLAEIQDMIAASEQQPGGPPLNLTRDKCLEQINLLERQRRDIETALAELRRIYTSFYAGPDDDRPPD